MRKTGTIMFSGVDISRPLSSYCGRTPPTPALLAASQYLGSFVLHQPHTTAELLGFGWAGRPDAPDNFPDLLAAFDRSKSSGEPLRVSDDHSDRSRYRTAEINLALSFWHDTHHVLRGRSFRVVDEIYMALWHLDVAQHDDVAKHSVAWHLLEAERDAAPFGELLNEPPAASPAGATPNTGVLAPISRVDR